MPVNPAASGVLGCTCDVFVCVDGPPATVLLARTKDSPFQVPELLVNIPPRPLPDDVLPRPPPRFGVPPPRPGPRPRRGLSPHHSGKPWS